MLGEGALLLGVMAVYFTMRSAASVASAAPLTQVSVLQVGLDFLTVVGRSLQLAVAPLPLSASRTYVPLGVGGTVLAAAAVIGVLFVGWRSLGARIGGLWFLGNAAVLALVVRSSGLFGDRYLYLPALALVLFLGGVSVHWGDRWRQGRRLVAAGVGVLVVLQAVTVMGRVPEWKDDRSLFGAAYRDNPRDWFGAFELGHIQARAGDWAGAVAWYERALEHNQEDPRLLSNAAAAWSNTGQISKALWAGERAVHAAPTNPRARYNFAVALAKAGRLEEARRELDLALAQAPDYRAARELRDGVQAALRSASGGGGDGGGH
jgi:hypothetical protein